MSAAAIPPMYSGHVSAVMDALAFLQLYKGFSSPLAPSLTYMERNSYSILLKDRRMERIYVMNSCR